MVLRHTVKFLDGMIDRVMLTVCLLFLFIGSYALVDTYNIFYQANDQSLLKFKPDGVDAAIVRELEGSIAWLTLDDSTVDYPVMQAEDNNYYVNRNPYGRYSLSGSIFLDSRNDPAFTDTYSLVYGHHMENGYMFGALDSWLDQEYFDSHRTGTLIINGQKHKLEIYAIVECDASEQAMFAPNEGYDPIGYIYDNATILNEETAAKVESSGRVLAMSTCKYPDTDDRTLLIAWIHD